MTLKLNHIACVADQSPPAQKALRELKAHYNFMDLHNKRNRPDVIVVLGGDGYMLQIMHKCMHRNIPFYGMNCGTVGFLMNIYSPENLIRRLQDAKMTTLYPLAMFAKNRKGAKKEALAINEVSLFRQSRMAAKIHVSIDHVVRIRELICDGVLVSTSAGSTAYNFSAGGPILPLGSNLVALTPLSPFRPRRWKGALLPNTASVYMEIMEPEKRPVSAVADFTEMRDVISVSISEQRKHAISVLFDPEHNLEEKMLKEQFFY